MKQSLQEILRAEKVIVELGIGDGRLLQDLAKKHRTTKSIAYIGIEKDKISAKQARMRVSSPNITIINSMFEESLTQFDDQSIDLVIMVLPDPDYIDPVHYDKWSPFYRSIIHSKLKQFGRLNIVTEIIDDLLEPVSDETYFTQVDWLISKFVGLGFKLLNKKNGPPTSYSSLYLDKFGADSQRIRIVTLAFVKIDRR